MNYYSTAHKAPQVSLQEAVVKGLAPDRGLYMPTNIHTLPTSFYDQLAAMTLTEMANEVAQSFWSDEVESDALRQMVAETLAFDIPLVKISETIYSLELFHGPTLAFKDVGGRFMARLLSYFVKKQSQRDVKVLVATSGDTGSAVANGFLGIEGIEVWVLYPKGKVTPIQECQFTTLGQNIKAVEVDGTFDDCQAIVKQAFMDQELNSRHNLTSANSINVARFLPQSFYYFYAVAQLLKMGVVGNKKIVVSVPSGNFGNITAGLIAKRMGLPISRFIAANNRNDIFFEYLKNGLYQPRPSVSTIANAMDVGDPSNFVRILDLYNHSVEQIRADVSAYRYDDEQIAATMREVWSASGYLLDPHGACGYQALVDDLKSDEIGIFLETAHPAKFLSTVESITEHKIVIPQPLQEFMKGTKHSIEISKDFASFKRLLLK